MFGLGRQRPHHYREMLRIAWENRDELSFAWRILRDGVCDGCALGTSGVSDWIIVSPSRIGSQAHSSGVPLSRSK